jgi:hypothetical protein
MNTSTNVIISKECDTSQLLKQLVSYYLPNGVYMFGSILNLICILCFIKIIRDERSNSSNMFKFFLLKSMSDFTFCFLFIPHIIYNYPASSMLKKSLPLVIWLYFFNRYIAFAAKIMSVFFELAASFDCLFFISQKLGALRTKRSFYIISIVIIVFCLTFSVISLLFRRIESEFSTEYNTTFYKTVKTQIYNTDLYDIYYMSNSIIRDIMPLILLILINIMVLIELKKATKRRQRLLTSKKRSLSTLKIARNVENNKIRMIVFTSLNHLLHIPIILYNTRAVSGVCSVVDSLFVLLYETSYAIPFFSFILFNKIFRKAITEKINSIRQFVYRS